MSLRFSEAAQLELEDAALFLEARERSLGERFLQAVSTSLILIQEHPRAWQTVAGDIRRCKVLGFPYGVIFVLRSDEDIEVIAVAHERRRLGYWRDRLKGPK